MKAPGKIIAYVLVKDNQIRIKASFPLDILLSSMLDSNFIYRTGRFEKQTFISLPKNVLHHRCVLTFILMTVVIICLWYNKQHLYYSTISMCVILDTIGLLLGIWKNRRLL